MITPLQLVSITDFVLGSLCLFLSTTLTYLFISLATFFLFKYTIQTFINEKTGKILSVIAYFQLVFFVVSSFLLHNFLLVIANYSPILMLFFTLNIIHLKSKKGNLYFIITCITIIIATLVQSLGFQISEFLNTETLYHIIAMIAYVIYYFGVAEILKEEQKS